MTCTIWIESIVASGTLRLLAQDAAGGQAAPDVNFWQQLLGNPLLLAAGMLVLFYVMVLAPERRRRAEGTRRLALLKKNDRVVTIGGIHAVVVSAPGDSDIITLRIDENSNTRIRVNRSAIATVLTDAAGSGETPESNKP